MNLLALRVGRNHNYWLDGINDWSNFESGPNSRAISNINPLRKSDIRGAIGAPTAPFFANSLFNYEIGAGAPVPGIAISSFFITLIPMAYIFSCLSLVPFFLILLLLAF